MVPPAGFGLAEAGLATVGAPFTTVTLAVPETAPLEAVTVNGPPAADPAVNRPLPLIVPPPLTDQLKTALIEAPNWSLAEALNCCVPFNPTVALAGETAIEVSVCDTVTVTLLVTVRPPLSRMVAVNV